MTNKVRLLAIFLLMPLFVAFQAEAATREEVRGRGYLQCGVATGLPGFSFSDENGNWTGFDVDLCRAVAAAVLGDAKKVRNVPLTARDSFTALQSGEVDLLAHDTGWTMTRDTSLGISFAGISYYDDQGFMVAGSAGITKRGELEGAAVCVQAGTTAELNTADFFSQNGMSYKPIVVDTPDQALKGFEAGRCSVVAGNLAHLQALRSRLAEPESAVMLQERMAREAMGPVVRQGDDAWFNIVKWTLFALVNGESLRLTADNVVQMQTSADPAVRRFLGFEGIKGQGLGLADDWAARIILQVGNYGEIFERNLGQHALLKLERGPNALWYDGGLQYAPPFR
ncbi:amino acid ABC transporter substrate-binding protein [Desulfopila aestuarii]|uniref:Amino acid ABC transporter substrate-binding protein, PAAT family (TC 3.A.1.3.-) n=1 Tax=Desulfopila aestuarii DSM 18488 TaxID=1121416 RepID=A0A1M7Y8U2_9BACT|nr:amino acid ABC transporter substrate-binding protein [Desulfopila aestuarii]SHO49053.1 amino acid ABC transporter substrate-binding protein, PAAT family (TC 3.A.1.3.-) [Desulfopila aestuarii DSM 18488]